MPENEQYLDKEYIEPTVTSDELETQIEDILLRACTSPLNDEDVTEFQQILAGRDLLKEKYQFDLEMLQQVAGAVDAWKKLEKLPKVPAFMEDTQKKLAERKTEVARLREIIDIVADEDVLKAASNAYLLITATGLNRRSNDQHNPDQISQQRAAELKNKLNDIIAFAVSRKIEQPAIEEAGKKWAEEKKKKERDNDLAEAQKLKLQLVMSRYETNTTNPFIQNSENEQLIHKITIIQKKWFDKQWPLEDEEVNLLAKNWTEGAAERKRQEAIREAQRLTKQLKVLNTILTDLKPGLEAEKQKILDQKLNFEGKLAQLMQDNSISFNDFIVKEPT